MDYPKVKKLYKYTSFGERSISILVRRKLWFPRPTTINDPFDCEIVNYSKGMLRDIKRQRTEFVELIRQRRPDKSTQKDLERKFFAIIDSSLTKMTVKDRKFVNRTEEVYSVLQSSINNFGILSLSETPRSILMWSHYSLSHTGMVFEFERSEHNKLGNEAKPVTYSNKRENDNQSSQSNNYDLFYVKHKGWQYEREWRLIENNGDQFYDFPGKLTSIICGALMPEQNIETISLLVESINSKRTNKISVKFANMSARNYLISICKRKPKKVVSI